MTLLWWHWVVAGFALAMGELALGTFFVIWFGLGAVLVGLVLLVAPELSITTQVLLWTLSSIGFTVLWFKVFRKAEPEIQAGQPDAAIGEIGVLVSAVEPFGRGQVRFQKPVMGAEAWPCLADTAIGAGERVRVTGIEGQLLKVSKA